mgnify:CR=1 FL=1|jgi:serine O-acetyltransferase
MKKTIFVLCIPLLIPHLLYYYLTNNSKIKQDIKQWLFIKEKNYSFTIGLVYLLLKYPEFRNVYYLRVNKYYRPLCFYLPQLKTLYIQTPSSQIGGGLYIGHGWGTVINAKKIGQNCRVNQNVTIGSRNLKTPIIGDNVNITAHAVVVGGIKIGNNSQIGAGAIVVKDVPDNAVVVPAKSNIIKINNQRCIIPL